MVSVLSLPLPGPPPEGHKWPRGPLGLPKVKANMGEEFQGEFSCVRDSPLCQSVWAKERRGGRAPQSPLHSPCPARIQAGRFRHILPRWFPWSAGGRGSKIRHVHPACPEERMRAGHFLDSLYPAFKKKAQHTCSGVNSTKCPKPTQHTHNTMGKGKGPGLWEPHTVGAGNPRISAASPFLLLFSFLWQCRWQWKSSGV